jgi:hypothetical protein
MDFHIIPEDLLLPQQLVYVLDVFCISIPARIAMCSPLASLINVEHIACLHLFNPHIFN